MKRQWPMNMGAILGSVLTAAGSAQFDTAPLLPAGVAPSSVVVSDFNNEGNLDFAVTNEIASGTVEVFLGNGRGHFESAATFSTNAFYSVAIGVVISTATARRILPPSTIAIIWSDAATALLASRWATATALSNPRPTTISA